MNVVVDSNQLHSDALRKFLSKSDANFAVLTDYAAMEAYKGNALNGIYESMVVLSQFPKQVIVLKSTRTICGLRGRRAGLQRRLIDEVQTLGFPRFIDELRLAQSGDPRFQRSLQSHGVEATAHLDRMLSDAQTTGANIRDIANMYSGAERAAIRLGHRYSSSQIDKIAKDVMYVAGFAFRDHPNANRWPKYSELPNTFIFRAALCTYLLALEYGAYGAGENLSPAKLRNDFVDMNFAAYGTYFDGLLTADAKAKRIHAIARVWLTALFDCELPSGIVS